MTFHEAIFKVSPRLHLAYCMAYAHLRYGPISQAINATYFLRLAWMFLRGKLILITTEQPVSNGGYRYFSLVISKRPVSSLHKYDDIGGRSD